MILISKIYFFVSPLKKKETYSYALDAISFLISLCIWIVVIFFKVFSPCLLFALPPVYFGLHLLYRRLFLHVLSTSLVWSWLKVRTVKLLRWSLSVLSFILRWFRRAVCWGTWNQSLDLSSWAGRTQRESASLLPGEWRSGFRFLGLNEGRGLALPAATLSLYVLT